MTRTVRIFLASSAELAEHRREFASFIGDQNKFWVPKGVFLELVRWEGFLDAMSDTQLQDEYNAALAACDLFVMLFRTKVGKYSAEEFDRAHERFKADGSPLIWTYFNKVQVDIGELDEDDFLSLRAFQKKLKGLGHFQTVYDHQDTLCRHFGDQLDELDRRGFFAKLPERDPVSPAPVVVPTRRDRELAHLTALVDRLGQHEPRYVPLAGEETQEQRLERVIKDLVVPSDVVFEAFGFDATEGCLPGHAERAEPKTYPDVLDAYRDLPQRGSVRRLAVLGEPGAGKSFSLGRIACELARAALADPARPVPVPVLVALGLWTDAAEPLEAFIARCSLQPPPGSPSSASETPPALLPADLQALRAEGRLLLQLDAVNEIPPGQRRDKVVAIAALAQDDRLAAWLLSCRQRDFEAELQRRLPFDTLRLQPLRPWQVRDFLWQTLKLTHGKVEGERRAENKFWQIAGGEAVREVWTRWAAAGETFERFWTVAETPDGIWENLIFAQWHDRPRREVLTSGRSLARLAENPYLLTLMTQLPVIPSNRAQLFAGFVKLLHQRERDARTKRGDAASLPPLAAWRAVLVQVAEALQRADGSAGDDGARTALARADWPAALSEELLAFSIDASVLQRVGDELRFTHQLLQESLAADVLLDAARSHNRPARDFWPTQNGWARSGWEVVAEIAAEACAGDVQAQVGLIRWLAETAPKVAANVWNHAGRPALPAELLAATKAQWFSRMTDEAAEPDPEARIAIGCWLGALDLDDRPGTGLTLDGLPDIDWVFIDDPRPFVYQEGLHSPLPPYAIARIPLTNRQWQAFLDDGGYLDDRWWEDLAKRPQPAEPWWSEPTAPRESMSWYEAMAYCRWLSARMGRAVMLPTEHQWERAARGVEGFAFPWGDGYKSGMANFDETAQYGGKKVGLHCVGRTSFVGLYPCGASSEGVHDMAGNVWEWCRNELDKAQNGGSEGNAPRALAGGAWDVPPEDSRMSGRAEGTPKARGRALGFRLVLSCPISGTEP